VVVAGSDTASTILSDGLLLVTHLLHGHSFHVIAEPDLSRDEGLQFVRTLPTDLIYHD